MGDPCLGREAQPHISTQLNWRIMRFKLILATLFGVLGIITLSACSNGDNAKAAFNKADVAFAQEMIPHHQQATEMAALAESRTTNEDVRLLAAAIGEAQKPEIDAMSGWLKTWGEKVSSDSSGGHDMSNMDGSAAMPGMMSDSDMKGLEATTGDDFDQMFLTMMIRHHKGAIEMAKTEEMDGKYPAAVDLAKKIQSDQAAEITTMEALLKS